MSHGHHKCKVESSATALHVPSVKLGLSSLSSSDVDDSDPYAEAVAYDI